MLLTTHTVHTNLFTHIKAAKKFIGAMSDLGGVRFLPLYDDASDTGLAMVSNKTLNTTRWRVAEILREEGDITEWILHPTPATLRFFPKLAGYQMFILND